jgi:hypothetical protein
VILPPRVREVLAEADEYLATCETLAAFDRDTIVVLRDRIAAVLAESSVGLRPHRRAELIAELQADGQVDYETLKAELLGMLEDIDGTKAEQHRISNESGSIALVVCLDENAATGSAYSEDLAAWKAAADADRND